MPDTLETEIDNPKSPIERKIAELGPWFHNLHLPDGSQTAPNHPLGDFPAFKWEEIASHIPERLDGWNVLDIGCNAGYYSFALARRGADVTGFDINPRYLRQARWAARQYQLEDQISFEEGQVYELARTSEQYDLVLFLGVFYHLRYPLLALDIVAERVRREMIFQSMMLPGDEALDYDEVDNYSIDAREKMRGAGWPRMAFIERRLEGDPTNWWIPNRAAVEALLRSANMRVTARPGRETYVCRPDADASDPATRPFIGDQLNAAVDR